MNDFADATYSAVVMTAMRTGSVRYQAENGRVAYVNWDEDNAEFYVEFVGKRFHGGTEVYLTMESDCPFEVTEELTLQMCG